MNVLVTGANGFVGRALCARLVSKGIAVRAAERHASRSSAPPGCTLVEIGNIGPDTDWRAALSGVDVVAHLAARVHVVHEGSADPLAAYRRVNVEGTARLARCAAAAGAKRLVFLSSIKVNGESSARPFTEADAAAPSDGYGMSKWEAELALARLAREAAFEFVALRPPLVYGPGVKANFLRLMRTVAGGVPLPLAAIDNRRSLVYVGNLVDAIVVCLTHPAVANRTWLVSDGEDLSTSDLARRLAAALAVHPRLLPVPPALLRVLGTLTGKRAAVERLTGSLQVDSTGLRRTTGWSPPFTVDQGLAETARWFRSVDG